MKIKYQLKRHAPDIAFGAGITFGAYSTYEACKGAIKVHDDMDNTKKHIAEEREKNPGGRHMLKTYLGVGMKWAKAFVPYAVWQAASIGCFGWAHQTQSNRIQALATGYMAIDAAFKGYRARTKERLGEETEREIRDDIREEEVVDKETGEVKTVKRAHRFPDNVLTYEFSRNTSGEYEYDADYLVAFLSGKQTMLNQRLMSAAGKQYMHLNEVLDELGLPMSKLGNELGWIYDPDDPQRSCCIDFGLFDAHGELLPGIEIVEGEPVYLVMNVDGPILEDCVKLGLLNEK